MDVFEDIYVCQAEDVVSAERKIVKTLGNQNDTKGVINGSPASLVYSGVRKIVDIDSWESEKINHIIDEVMEISFLRYKVKRKDLNKVTSGEEVSTFLFV